MRPAKVWSEIDVIVSVFAQQENTALHKKMRQLKHDYWDSNLIHIMLELRFELKCSNTAL